MRKFASGLQQWQRWPDYKDLAKLYHQLRQQAQVVEVLSPPFSSLTVKCAPCSLTLRRGSRSLKVTKCLRKLLRISYLGHKTYDGTRSTSLWAHRNLFWQLSSRRKLVLFGHTRHGSVFKTILKGTLGDGRRRSRQRKCWEDNIKEWTSLLMPELFTTASSRKDWKRISAESSVMSPRRPNRSRD